MNTMHNSVMLSGRLGSGVEITHLGAGKHIGRVSIATHEYLRDQNGNGQERTLWHNLVAWGDTAERMQRYLTKGTFAIIHGKLVNREYLDRDGKTRFLTEIVVKEFSWLKSTASRTDRSAA
jgi:single-strand DNA-binding protein